MNIVLWVLQVLLALHTVMGAIWKFSNSEQTVPSLASLPHGLWMALIGFEFLASLALLLPAVYKGPALLVPIAALYIVVEMLMFSGFHLYSGTTEHGPMIYWLVVAVICAFIAYGRYALSPL